MKEIVKMKKLKKIDFYLIPLFSVMLISVILRTVALFTSFNSTTMHFENKAAILVSGILVAIASVGFCSYLFLGDKERELISTSANPATYIPAGLVSCALLFMGVHCLTSAATQYVDPLPLLLTICAVLAFVSVASFFLSVFIEQGARVYKAAFSLAIVLFLALYATYLFFNKSVHPTNSPNKVLDQLAYVSAAVFFLYESRIHLGRAKWRGYVCFGLIASLLTAYSALPSLIVYAATGYTVSDSIVESALSLLLCLLITSRVIQSASLTPAEKCAAAIDIERLAAKRDAEIKESSLAHARDNDNGSEDMQESSNYTFDIPYVDDGSDLSGDSAEIDLTNQ